MKILALEFSSAQRSVAVVENVTDLRPIVRSIVSESGPGATCALSLVERALAQGWCGREQIEILAIGLGPGSYTGIRSAIALAQGWQLARGVKLLGISSVECLAAKAQAQGWTGRVQIVVDAQRDEFYLAGFAISPTEWSVLEPLRLAKPHEVQAKAAEGCAIVGPEVNKWFGQGQCLFPCAGILGELACCRRDYVQGEELEPIYLREASFAKAPPPRVLPTNQ
jgi:tRNA threonylcarbamoyladenosine biosynthesis protein TsaB